MKGEEQQQHSCFLDEQGETHCSQAAWGVPVPDGRSLPLLLGVGPAKTSSTALFELLGHHPRLVLGNSTLVGHDCCGSELYYFSRRFNATQPAAGLSKYFTRDGDEEGEGEDERLTKDTQWLAEKTPEYSDHFLVPYRIKATLQPMPGVLSLVFTLRDPLDAHVSLYFYRMARKQLPSSARGFLEWSQALYAGHDDYQQCVKKQLKAVGWSDINAELVDRRIEDTILPKPPTWLGIQSVDEAIFQACRAPHFQPSDKLEGLGSLLYSTTLPRWKKVLEGAPSLCVFHQDVIKRPAQEATRVAQFLGLDPLEMDRALRGTPIDTQYASRAEVSPEQRVLQAEGGDEKETAAAVRRHMSKLKNLFAGEMEYAKQFCANL